MLDAISFDSMYRRYAQPLARIAATVTHDSADAEDVAQDAWMEAWKARDSIDKPGLWAWLCRVLRRLWWHRLNRAGKKRDSVAVPVESADSVAVDGGQEEAAQASQVERAVKSLPTSMAIPARMTLAGLEQPEIARLRGVTQQAVSDALRRAVKLLRKQWSMA